MITKLGGGTYQSGQIPEILYEVSGGSIDWIYSWCHWVGGIANLSYTVELELPSIKTNHNLTQSLMRISRH